MLGQEQAVKGPELGRGEGSWEVLRGPVVIN